MAGFWITYTEKNGKPAKPVVMQDEQLARKYAASVKGKVEPIEDEVPSATVEICPSASKEMVQDSTRAYYDLHWNPRVRTEPADIKSEEHRAELEMEYVTQARLAGVSTSDALADLNGWTRG